MTELHLALLASGVNLPSQTKRIWVWLSDHQPQSAKSVAAALHIPEASSLLSMMERHRMVTSTKDLNRSTGNVINRYSTVGREYELLPMPKKVKSVVTLTSKVADFVAAAEQLKAVTQPPVAAPVQPADAVKFDLDTLTIAEARALYVRLAKMFNGESV